jgi:hypothetical protein
MMAFKNLQLVSFKKAGHGFCYEESLVLLFLTSSFFNSFHICHNGNILPMLT